MRTQGSTPRAGAQARGDQDTAVSTFFSTHPGIQERPREQERPLRASPGGARRTLERFTRAVASS